MIRTVRQAELEQLVEIDDAAGILFAQAGLELAFEAGHPFVAAELDRWGAALARGTVRGFERDGELVAFAVLGRCDGVAYLEQLSVHPTAMRSGIGTVLLRHVVATVDPPLWLTTYAHLPWNRPYYERFGFAVSDVYGPELARLLEEQRRYLPAPEERVAMCRSGDA